MSELQNETTDQQDFEDSKWGASQLRNIGLLSVFTDDELTELYSLGDIQEKKAKSHVIIEGEASRGVFVLLHGSVSVLKTDRLNNLMRLAILEPGEFFGELSLFDDAPRSATVVAESSCKLFSLTSEMFQEFLASHGEEAQVRFYKNCAEEMAQRFRKQNGDYIASQQLIWEHALRKSGSDQSKSDTHKVDQPE